MSPTKKNRRCPNGTRRNKKTGLCEPIQKVQSPSPVQSDNIVEPIPPLHEPSLLIEQPPSSLLAEPEPQPLTPSPTPFAEQPPSSLLAEPEPQPPTPFVEQPPSSLLAEPKPQPSTPLIKSPVQQIVAIPGKRCPNGTRRNKKTGLCEKITASPIIEKEKTSIIVSTNKTRRCPPGYRKHPKNGVCISIDKDKENELELEKEPYIPLEKQLQKYETPVVEKAKEPELGTDKIVPEKQVLQIPISTKPEMNKEDLAISYDDISPESNDNDEIFKLEKQEYYSEKTSPNTEYDFLYPNLNDPMFNAKLADRKEFYDTQYDGDISTAIKTKANQMCNVKFELMPHQLFVKNFMSFQTPYNGLLLYHGLGSGKTCSAIGIAEEMRQYMKQVGIKQRIIVVASPNVQGNFRMQLFDDRKLRKIPNPNQIHGIMGSDEDIWDIHSCIGNSLLKEINPANLKGLSREKVISQINSIINTYYVFMGYGQFANYIQDKISISSSQKFTEKERTDYETRNIRRAFNNRLVIIDEVHNIRLSDENNNKKTAALLMKVAKYSDNMRLLLLSATPMFNSYKEIIWITNLLNINDKRSMIDSGSVFDKDGNYRQGDEKGIIESGDSLLKRKLTGYVSYVRGENPFIFPYRIYPHLFAPEHTFDSSLNIYPTHQMNGMAIDEKIKYLRLYLNTCGKYQETVYNAIIENMRRRDYSYQTSLGDTRELPSFENMESFGYTLLQTPIESLNMVYPNPEMEKMIAEKPDVSGDVYLNTISKTVGNEGLMNIMDFDDIMKPSPMKHNFKYKTNVETTYGRIFSPELISLYSAKIANICNIIKKSTGIIVVYSQYIHGGIIPLALALEEMGFSRYSSTMSYQKNLFRNRYAEQIDARTMEPRSQMADPSSFHPVKYMMITGDKSYSPSNTEDIKYATHPDNKYGEQVKVILVSKAGSEGLDFKNVRQVHIMEPWYNMNRIEQIIGRGVRNLSHCDLPFEERNVEIYLHSTLLPTKKDEEAVDLYVYRFAEKKAVQIGRVSRTLKETSVDCILNISQSNFTAEKLAKIAENQNIQMRVSSQKTIDFKIGDEPYSSLCDYMENCEYTCSPSATVKGTNRDTYQSYYAKTNNDNIMKKIAELYREKSFYKRDHLIKEINRIRPYPIEQIYHALSIFIRNKNEYLVDKYGRIGNLTNKDEYYVFQPVEITDPNSSIYERSVPVDFKRRDFVLEVPTTFITEEKMDTEKDKGKDKGKGKSATEIEKIGDGHEEDDKYEDAIGLINKMASQYDIVFSTVRQNIASGEKNWYKHANHVMDNIHAEYFIPMDTLKEYVLYHMLDLTMFDNKLVLLKYLLSPDRMELDTHIETEIIPICLKYFDKKMMFVEDTQIVFLTKDNVSKLYIREGATSEWEEADAEDYKYYESLISRFVIPKNKINGDIIGFVNMFKNKDMVFKIKDVRQKRNNVGARCGDSTTKSDVVKALNSLVNDDNKYDETFHIGLCVLIEMLLRWYSEIEKDGKIYYFDPEQTFVNNIVKT